MTTKNQGTKHSLPPKPTLSFPTTVEETTRGLSPWSELCSASAHDHCSEQNAVMLTTAPTKQEIGHELATTPPFPTPALTASSLSSTSFLGEHSPDLALTASANTMHNSFDHPYMTWRSRVKASDDLHLRSCLAQHNVGSMDHNLPTQQLSYCHEDGGISSLSSAFSGLTLSNQQGRDSANSVSIAPRQIDSPSTETTPPTPLLIPMQPTGAGVPLTSVVETLSSKGSKAAAEDPETVAAAYKLCQWGIGIGPGINPKVATSRNGTHGRGRSTASEPPIVNTGNVGPMCVQPGDWICTSCGFVNWRRRGVCLRCFPLAQGNEIGRGIQAGEMIAKKLAAGLETNSEEYTKSVQALSSEKAKRGLHTYQQRPVVHELPENPLQAYGGGGHGTYNAVTYSQLQEAGTCSYNSNYLGLQFGPLVQQQWRQQFEHSGLLVDQSASRALDHLRQLQAQPQSSCDLQQQNFGGDNNSASNPYKNYGPPVRWTSSISTSSNTHKYESASLSQRPYEFGDALSFDTAERMQTHRSATNTAADELLRQISHKTQPQQDGSPGPSRTSIPGWQRAPQEAPSALGSQLPRDIWAPAPKGPRLIPMDPIHISRGERTKPQPIGTRSSAATSGSSADDRHRKKDDTLETAGSKDINNADWISDLYPFTSASVSTSAPASTSASTPAATSS